MTDANLHIVKDWDGIMRKNVRRFLSVILSVSMILSPVLETTAANQFNVENDEVDGKLLFPGDSVEGANPIYIVESNDSEQKIEGGSWTNKTEQAYKMENREGEEEGLYLQPMGYVLTVISGTSQMADEKVDTKDNHYKEKEKKEEEESKDIAYYQEKAKVRVKADDAEEGHVFDHWEVEDSKITLEDTTASEIEFEMIDAAVILTAVYKEKETETETQPPTETETETQPPTETETETQPPTETETETQPPTETETETQPPTETDTETQPPTETETETQPPTETETETQPPTETETETQPQTETEAKFYRIDLSDTQISVEGATYEGSELRAKAGDTITITAPTYEDRLFQEWRVSRSDTEAQITVLEDEEDYRKASFTMPESIIYVEAVYAVLQKNQVQVINGSGSGTYLEGEYVEIEADKAAEGQRFKKWTVITGDIELEDRKSEKTGFMMPDEAVQVKAVYEVIKYTLTVNNGNGSGSYVKGDKISLTANYPASGKVFDTWKVTSDNASVSAPDRYYSSITMPAADVIVEATYKDGPSPDYNEIQNILPGGEYLKGHTISFTAVGNGMANTNPNPGDYRYRPTGYQIGNTTGNWNNAPYTTSLEINTVGQYTLTVTYNKDIFDGSNWVADGTTVTKSVTFNVVNELSVKTGDNSPILALVITATIALVVIIALILLKNRRK